MAYVTDTTTALATKVVSGLASASSGTSGGSVDGVTGQTWPK